MVFITVQNLFGIDTVVSIICKFQYLPVRLENAYYAPKIGVFEDLKLNPEMGSGLIATPKKHLLLQKHVIWHIDRQNRYTGAGWARAEESLEKQRKKVAYTKKPQRVTTHMFAETTHVVASPYGFVCVVIPPT